MFEGIYPALVTPLKHGSIDTDALERTVSRQLEAGVHGLVICATTGEGATLTPDEKNLVIKSVVRQVEGKIHVIVGVSQIATWSVIESTKSAADLGADAVLVATPPYVRPTQDGLVAHYESVADQVGLPIVLYNVPSRTACDLLPASVARLARHEKIVGIKEATGSMYRAQQVLAAADGKLSVLSGDDPLTLSLLIAGGHGVISTGANVTPSNWVALWNAWKSGDLKAAASIQNELAGLHEALFLESNPGPVKAALHMLGLIEPEIRLPLVWPAKQVEYRLAAELEQLGYKVNVS